MTSRACAATTQQGDPCQAPPLRDGAYCLMHDPDHADEVAEGRRLGGYRRKREAAVRTTFDIEGLATVPQIRRLVEVAVSDTLALENSISRNRTLAYLAQTASRLLETDELADRVAALEATLPGAAR